MESGLRSPPPAKPLSPERIPRGISRTTWNFVLDTTLLVVFVALLFASIVVRFVFPPVSESAGWILWGGDLETWLGVQFGLLSAFTLGIVLHLMLHWTWVCGVVAGWLPRSRDGKKRLADDGSRTIAGVGLMIVILNLLGLLIAAASLGIKSPF